MSDQIINKTKKKKKNRVVINEKIDEPTDWAIKKVYII